jgi:hypothetical protein
MSSAVSNAGLLAALTTTDGAGRVGYSPAASYPSGSLGHALQLVLPDTTVSFDREPLITATAGQTLITLSSVTYEMGVNALFVSVDGSTIPKEDITEVSTSSFSLATPLSVGQEVDVRVGNATTSGISAAAVSHAPRALAATPRSGQEVGRDFMWADEFYANGSSGLPVDFTGAVDSTLGLNAALAHVASRGGGDLLLKPGNLRVSGELLYGNACGLVGPGEGICLIHQYDGSKNTINVPNTAASCTFAGARIIYEDTPVSGVAAIVWRGGNGTLRNFLIQTCAVGLDISAVVMKLNNFSVGAYTESGILVHDCNDVFLEQFLFEAGSAANGSLGGIRLLNFVEAFSAVSGDIIHGQYGLTCDATSYALRQRPGANKFTNVYFDSASTTNILLNNTVATTFTNCWASYAGVGTSAGNNIVLQQTEAITWQGGEIIAAGGHGVVIGALSKHAKFKDARIAENSTFADNTYDGINVAAGTTDFEITGNSFNNNQLFVANGGQRYGAYVNAGASDRYFIERNLVTGNRTGGVSDNGTGVNKSVARNY